MRFGAILASMVTTLFLAAPATATSVKPETGLLHRAYAFAEAGMPMPYTLYVPKSYDGSKPYPLAVYLHGASGDETEAFAETNLAEIAEKNGVIVVAPLGYSPFGGYGDIYPVVATDSTGAPASDSASCTIGECAARLGQAQPAFACDRRGQTRDSG